MQLDHSESKEITTRDLHPVEELQGHGVNMSDIKKLKEAGIATIAGLMMTTTKQLFNIKGFSEAKVNKLRDAAQKFEGFGFVSGTASMAKRANLVRITTGSDALDTLLGGGMESCSITELYGEFRTGKTQLCLTLCVTAQLPLSQKGGNGKVAFIDTEGTFRAERVAQIADRFELNSVEVLDNILVARAYTHEGQIQLLQALAAKMSEEKFSLIIVDSATALFRVDFSGRGELNERQIVLGQFLSRLTKLAEEFEVAVVLTNQVVADPGATAMFATGPKPIGGHIMAHASTTRLSLKKGKGDQRICKVVDSPSLPEADCTFQLGEGGVQDCKD